MDERDSVRDSAMAFDEALIGSAFAQIAERGWRNLNLADAARDGGLPLDDTRSRFPTHVSVLLTFGKHADRAALAEASLDPAGPVKSARELLFDMLMRRFDVLQQHRDGVIALLHGLPADPGLAAILAAATTRSMGWMLAGAGIASSGLAGFVRVNLLTGVWVATLRAWERDQSLDLSATMAALDRALDRLGRVDRVFAADRAAATSIEDADLSDVVVDPDAPLLDEPLLPDPRA